MDEEKKKELVYNRIRKRKPGYIALVTDYIHLKKNKSDELKNILNIKSSLSLGARMFTRDCSTRVSFNSGSPSSITTSTSSSINYLLKNGDREIIASNNAFKNIDKAQEFFKGKKIIRMMISPEDKGVSLEKCVKKTISYLEEKTGQKIYYVSSLHTDTDHLHAHIVISREDGGNCSEKNPLTIPKDILITGVRENLKRIISDELGYLTADEYYKKFERNIDKLGSARIDYYIERGRKANKNKTSLTKEEIVQNIPLRLKKIAEDRLEYLSGYQNELQIVKDKDNKFSFLNDNWQLFLRSKDKSKIFTPITKNEKVIIDNYIRPGRERVRYEGVIVDKKITEADIEKVAFLIRDDKNELHFAERKLSYDKMDAFKKGDRVAVSVTSSSLLKTATGYKKRESIVIKKLEEREFKKQNTFIDSKTEFENNYPNQNKGIRL